MDPPEWNAPRLTPFLSAPRAKLLRPVPPVKPAGRRSNPPERNAVPPSPPTPSRRLERRSTPPLGLRGPTNRRAVRPFPLPLLPPRRRSARPEPGSFASTGAIGSIRRPLSPLATADEKTVR
uniref:Uncharacterized protein n=1 Tax=Triticum urartu TaxID=4572 RepID=A0A8R7UWK8_TRIUA